MRHKVADLEGALLDAAVAKCEGLRFEISDGGLNCYVAELAEWIDAVTEGKREYQFASGQDTDQFFSPSSFWEHGGPIIDREQMAFLPGPKPDADGRVWWRAHPVGWGIRQDGPTHLIAACRARVASKFGEEIEL